MKKKVFVFSVIFVILCIGLSSADEGKKTMEPIKLILFSKPSPLIVGEAKGFFAEEGIRLDLTMTRNSVEQIRGILAGTWDLAQTATDNVVAYVEKENADLAVFAGIERGYGITLFVSPDIKSAKDLKGKVLGVDSLTTGFTFILRKMLLVNGLDFNKKDYELVAVGGTAQRFKAMQEGKIAGGLLNVPFDYKAKQEGFVPLISVTDIFDNFLSTVWVGRRAWAEANRDLFVRYLRAYIKSVEWTTAPSSRKEAAALLAKDQKVSEQAASGRLARDSASLIPKAAIDLKGMEAVINLRAELGFLKTPVPPLEKYYDQAYYNQALKR